MSEHDHRLLGARDGLVSAMLIVRREIGNVKSRLSWMPERWTKRRAPLVETLEMLQRMDAELDQRRRECADAWQFRQAVEIVSPDRPAAIGNLN